MISIKNLVKIYNKGKGNEYKALKGIDFQVQDGELVAVIGKSGAGKSTLLHVLAGIDSFESGSYHVGNQDVGQMSEKQLAEFRNKSIGMVMQDFALIEEYTVQENLLVPLIFGKVKKREQSKKIMDVLEKINGSINCPAGRNKEWRLPEPLLILRSIFWQMSLQGHSTAIHRMTSWMCLRG